MGRCPHCLHALSKHNDLGYCVVSSRSKGECPCDSTPRDLVGELLTSLTKPRAEVTPAITDVGHSRKGRD